MSDSVTQLNPTLACPAELGGSRQGVHSAEVPTLPGPGRGQRITARHNRRVYWSGGSRCPEQQRVGDVSLHTHSRCHRCPVNARITQCPRPAASFRGPLPAVCLP